MITLSRRRALAMRMSALLLSGEQPVGPTAVVSQLCAMQGQDFGALKWAIAARMKGRALQHKRAAIEGAFNSGEIVRSWPLRSTVHVIAAQDLGWVQRATNARLLALIDRWLAKGDFQGLDARGFERLQAVTIDALKSYARMSRRQLFGVWEAEGLAPTKGGGYEFIWALCQQGVTVLGPTGASGELDVVLADDWITSPTVFDGEEALAELARRYARGHGPATEYDLSWWSGLGVVAARKAIAAAVARGELHACDVDGTTMWATPEQFDGTSSTGPLHVLGAFDEHLLGYKDRTLSLDAAHARAAMTVNGIAQPTVVKAGRVVAVWKVRDGSLTALDGVTVSERDLQAAQRRIATVRTWLGRGD